MCQVNLFIDYKANYMLEIKVVPRANRPYGLVALFFERKRMMNSIGYQLFWIILVFGIMFFVYFFLLSKKIKKGNINRIGEFTYLMKRFSLDQKKINTNQIKLGICIINAFIISFVSNFIMLIPVSMMFRLLIGFVLLFALIYALYEIYGKFLKKKYGKD